MRKKRLDPKIIREGDLVRVINPEFVVSCGYENNHKAAAEWIGERFGNQILRFIYDVGKAQTESAGKEPKAKFESAFISFDNYEKHLRNPHSYSKIISALAYDRVNRLMKSGMEKKLITKTFPDRMGTMFTVGDIFYRQTGIYWPPSRHYDNWTGECDCESGGLNKVKHHKILIPTWRFTFIVRNGEEDCLEGGIEATNVEKVNNDATRDSEGI